MFDCGMVATVVVVVVVVKLLKIALSCSAAAKHSSGVVDSSPSLASGSHAIRVVPADDASARSGVAAADGAAAAAAATALENASQSLEWREVCSVREVGGVVAAAVVKEESGMVVITRLGATPKTSNSVA